MPVTYAGEKLNVASPQAAAWVEHNISAADVYEFRFPLWSPLAWPGPVVRFRHPDRTPMRPLKVGHLWWPTGAARWASSHWLVTDLQLAAIRATVYPEDDQYLPADLVLDDGRDTITAEMWMLPPRPLAQVVGTARQQMFLLSLVDERYFWWWRRGTLYEVMEGTTTWLNVYDAIGVILDVAINADTPHADFLGPSRLFNSTPWTSIPVLLDEVARQCGQTVARDLDGTVSALNYDSSSARFNQNWFFAYQKRAGGAFALTP